MIARLIVIVLVIVVFSLIVQVNLFVRILAIPIVLVFVWDLFNYWRDQKRLKTEQKTTPETVKKGNKSLKQK